MNRSNRELVRRYAGVCAALFVIAPFTSVDAAVRRASPDTLARVLASAQSGDEIVLAPGSYDPFKIRLREFVPALRISASGAVFNGIVLEGVRGVSISGGEFRPPPGRVNPKTGTRELGHGLRIGNSREVRVSAATFLGPGAASSAATPVFGEGWGVTGTFNEGLEISDSTFRGLYMGISLARSRNVGIKRNRFELMRSDGVQLAESQGALIEGNTCRDTRIRDYEHADCIQLWSRPNTPPTSDITIRRNQIEGATQGIGLFNHEKDGVNDGGFDRIIIEENDVHVSMPQAIALYDGRDSVVRNNRVRTAKGATYRASINLSKGVTRCGNVVEPGAGKPGMKDKRC